MFAQSQELPSTSSVPPDTPTSLNPTTWLPSTTIPSTDIPSSSPSTTPLPTTTISTTMPISIYPITSNFTPLPTPQQTPQPTPQPTPQTTMATPEPTTVQPTTTEPTTTATTSILPTTTIKTIKPSTYIPETVESTQNVPAPLDVQPNYELPRPQVETVEGSTSYAIPLSIALACVILGMVAFVVWRRRRAKLSERDDKRSMVLSPAHYFSDDVFNTNALASIRPSEVSSCESFETARFTEMVRARVNLS